MGEKNIVNLLKCTNEKRNKLIDGWFQIFIGRSLYRVMNSASDIRHTNEQQMKFIFLAKMHSDRIKNFFEEMVKSSFY